MDSNKRATPRVSFTGPVSYGLREVTVNGAIACNISLSGISLKIQGFVPVGTVLEVQICLDTSSSKVIWVKAKVVRVRELSEDCYELGLKFIRDEESTRAIGKFVYAGLNQQRS